MYPLRIRIAVLASVIKGSGFATHSILVSIQRVLYYRLFAPLIRGAEHSEGFILFIFAERAKMNKPKPFGQITLTLIN